MRLPFGIILFLCSVSMLPAVTINSGTYSTAYVPGWPHAILSTLESPEVSIWIMDSTVEQTCASTCNIAFTQSYTFVADSTPTVSSALIHYGGNSYSVGETPGTNTSFVLNLNFSGPTVPVTMTELVSPGTPVGTMSGSVSGIPFTMTGSATLIVNGNVIFSNLALSGSGLARYSYVDIPPPAWSLAGRTYAFASEVPEPSSYAATVLGLAVLLALRHRPNQ